MQSLILPSFAQDRPATTGAANVEIGRITYLDPVSMDFVVQDGAVARQVWTSRATRFRTNHPGASFFDLAVGRRVAVIFHQSGQLAIADEVTY